MHMPTLATIQMYSHALESSATYAALLPDPELVGPGPYPVLVQLHGYYDNYTAWLYKSNLMRHMERLPLIVVLPSSENYWWCDYHPRARYEKFVAFDLWKHVNDTFPTRKDRWAIGGLSMGGFGALRLGLKYPNKYASIFAHSSVIPSEERLADWDEPLSQPLQVDLNCYRHAEKLAKMDPTQWPRLSFDCGVDDHLIEDNRAFHKYLAALKVPHTYQEHPGAHTWEYWDLHVQTALKQHAEVFNIKEATEG